MRKCFHWEETHRAPGAGAESPREAVSADAGGNRLASSYDNVCLHGAEQPHQRDAAPGGRDSAPQQPPEEPTVRPETLSGLLSRWLLWGPPSSDQEKTAVPQPTLSLVGPGGLAGLTGRCGTRGKVSANSVTPLLLPLPRHCILHGRGQLRRAAEAWSWEAASVWPEGPQRPGPASGLPSLSPWGHCQSPSGSV